jgi:hypothetical protein
MNISISKKIFSKIFIFCFSLFFVGHCTGMEKEEKTEETVTINFEDPRTGEKMAINIDSSEFFGASYDSCGDYFRDTDVYSIKNVRVIETQNNKTILLITIALTHYPGRQDEYKAPILLVVRLNSDYKIETIRDNKKCLRFAHSKTKECLEVLTNIGRFHYLFRMPESETTEASSGLIELGTHSVHQGIDDRTATSQEMIARYYLNPKTGHVHIKHALGKFDGKRTIIEHVSPHATIITHNSYEKEIRQLQKKIEELNKAEEKLLGRQQCLDL